LWRKHLFWQTLVTGQLCCVVEVWGWFCTHGGAGGAELNLGDGR
jgi:hypothetical protein